MKGVVATRAKMTAHAGGKAKSDVRTLALRHGMRPVDMDNSGSHSQKARRSVLEAPSLARSLSSLRADEVLLCQYPIGQVGIRIASRLGRQARSIAFIHDIESLRQGVDPSTEMRLLGRFDAVVVHTPAMQRWLQAQIPGVSTAVLDVFDYLVAEPHRRPVASALPASLVVAGSLRPSKARYLYELGSLPVPVRAYGPECDQAMLPDSVEWRGVLDPDAPGTRPVDGFGVVWDGLSPSGLRGAGGNYLRYNAPHKFSFYLTMGMPVVVCRESAMAPFVEANGIGLCFDSIAQAAEAMGAVTPAQWSHMLASVWSLRDRIVAGHFTAAALGKLAAG